MKYRDNICAVIRNGNSVFVCHRIGEHPDLGWQFPQGGIDGEISSDADLILELKRELLEEIGTDEVKIISILPNSYKYEYPQDIRKKFPEYIGQNQRWILCSFKNEPQKINFNLTNHPEFDDYKWVSVENAIISIVEFKRDVYKKALFDLGLLPKLM